MNDVVFFSAITALATTIGALIQAIFYGINKEMFGPAFEFTLVRRAGDVVMSSAYNARIANAQKEGYHLDLTWNGGMYGMDYWAIPKGAANQQAARDFIAFALRPEIQLAFSEIVPHGPTNLNAIEKLSAEAAHWIPNSTENLKQVLAIGDEFWSDHGEELDARFIAWLAQ